MINKVINASILTTCYKLDKKNECVISVRDRERNGERERESNITLFFRFRDRYKI